ncbi:MAG: AbrB/MazE/SpoVT family DNA-binding domain-containing protein [Nitrososphaerales archaeon]
MKWDTEIDSRGRIVIPSEIRDELKLRPEQKLSIETRNKRELILRLETNPEEFISEMKGCVSRSKIKPLELKQIWGVGHTHD